MAATDAVESNDIIVAFTGHRPEKIGGYNTPNPTEQRIRQKIRRILSVINPQKCIVGMALGVDTIAAEVCIEMGIPFIAAVPFKGQEKLWGSEQQAHYHYLVSKASEVVIVCSGGYRPQHMQERNRYMVDGADILVAVWDGTTGGTRNCKMYAESKRKPVIRITP